MKRKSALRRKSSVASARRQSIVMLEEAQLAALTLPTLIRHIESCLATTMWLGVLPMVYFVHHHAALTCVVLVIVICLIVHAYSLRPYCTEFGEEEEEAVNDLLAGKPVREIEHLSEKAMQEEWKLVSLVMIVLSGVASVVALSMGGAKVLRAWTAPMVSQCTVADLKTLETNYHRFHCQDGFVDRSQQQTFMEKGGVMVGTYTVYRIVPVYLKPSDVENATVPIAWGVSKNDHITDDFCENGVCGMFTSMDSTALEITSYRQLAKELSESVVAAGAHEFDSSSIPTVVLTNPINPEGKAICFVVAAVFYIFVLSGLCCLQYHMYIETTSKADSATRRRWAGDASLHASVDSEVESGYEALNGFGQRRND